MSQSSLGLEELGSLANVHVPNGAKDSKAAQVAAAYTARPLQGQRCPIQQKYTPGTEADTGGPDSPQKVCVR